MKNVPFRSTLQAIPAVDPPRFAGVYFLLDGDEIVYVGQSIDVPQRINAHRSRRDHAHARWRIKWDRALWIPVPEKELDAYEGALIRRLTPRHNTGAPADASRDDEICTALNLPPRDPSRLAVFLDRRRASYTNSGKARAAFNLRRKKAMTRYRKHGVDHIKNPWVRGRKMLSGFLWNAVAPFVEAS